ncbi:MAG: helix-turn-helix domain-containing protein [Sandaracinaceae bacterium]
MGRKVSDVLLIDSDPVWCEQVERQLAEEGASVRVAHTLREVKRALSTGTIDGVLVDLDALRRSERRELIERLTHASTAPAVVVWSRDVSVQEAFELGRLGVREFRHAKPRPRSVSRLLARSLATRPVLEPRLRAMVGHATQSEMIRIVREIFLDQALAACRGNKTQAGRLLRISRQAVEQRIRPAS